MENKKFVIPEMEIITFGKDDVIVTSTSGDIWKDTNCNGIPDLFE